VTVQGAALRDTLTESTYPLNAVGEAIVRALREPPTAESLLNDLSRKGFSRATAERELRQMALLGLFEHTCDTSRKRLASMRGGEAPPIRVLEGSRFGCQNSGACCRGYLFGYVSEDEKTRIESLDPRASLPGLRDGDLFIEAGRSLGRPLYRLASVNDACVFLERGSCGLHRAFGVGAKPRFCQLFPLGAFATIEGLKVYDRGECATFAVSARSGTLLAEDAARIRALVSQDIYHPVAHVHGSWRCDYGLVLALARRLDSEITERLPFAALNAIGHLARGFVVALVECPLAAGQPEAAIDAILGCCADTFRPAEEVVASGARTGLRALSALAEALAERVDAGETHGRSFSEAARMLASVGRAASGGDALSARAAAAAALPAQADCDRAMRLSLRHLIFGRELLLDDHLPAGLLRMAFVLTLTSAAARLRALEANAAEVSPLHFSGGHMIVRRVLHRPGPHAVLKANGEQVWPILQALPLLARNLGFNTERITAVRGGPQ
jgi:hypothetical protein